MKASDIFTLQWRYAAYTGSYFANFSGWSIVPILKCQGGQRGCTETSITRYHCTLHNVTGERTSLLFGGGSLRSRKMKEHYVTRWWHAG